jgi:hypothetical protein
MRFEDLNWMDVENYLKTDDRLMLVVGACEEHGYLMWCVVIVGLKLGNKSQPTCAHRRASAIGPVRLRRWPYL